MIIKVTAVATFACAVLLYALSALSPNAPYFYMVSGAMPLSIVRLTLATLALVISFYAKFHTAVDQWIVGATGVILIILGLAGITIPSLDYALFAYVKPLDYLFCVQFGVIFTLTALVYRPTGRRMPRLSRPRHPQLRLFSTPEA